MKQRECQPVLARVTGTVAEVVGTFAVAVHDLVGAETVFRAHLEMLVAQGHDGPEQQ